jgi:Trk K+ transport system NAD-binding subunit
MFDHDMGQKMAHGFNIKTAFSTSALAAPAFARAAMRADIIHAFYVGDHLLNVSELQINKGSSLIGREVCDLESELDFSIILHARNGQVDMHPAPHTVLESGDQLCVFASLEVLNQLRRLNHPGAT